MDLNLFPTRISEYNNKELATQILPVVDEYLALADTMMSIDNHITTYINPELSHRLNVDMRMKPAFDWCIETALYELTKRGVDVRQLQLNPHFFVNEIRQGGYFHRHAHPNAIFSGVFYLDATSETSDIVFYDPRPYKTCRVLPMLNNDDQEFVSVSVETGKLLLWESWLEHEVVQNKSPRPRKTLVFNM